MKKVLIVCKLPPPYLGTTVWAETLVKSKLSNYFTLFFFNINTHTSIATVGKIRLIAALQNFLLYFKFLAKLISFRPDLVLIPFSQSAWGFIKDSLYMQLSVLSGKKPLLMLHGSNFRTWHNSQNRLMRWYCKKTICNSKGVVVLGHNLKELFSDWVGEKNVFVVPNGLNVNFPLLKNKNQHTIQLTYLGNLQASKGIEDVVRAVSLLKNKNRVCLNVVGGWRDNKTKDFCIQYTAENQLPIKYQGALHGEEKLRILAETDIFIFPPRMPEGHPLVIVEAMAAGLPIISSNQGAITESVIDGVNGFIVPVLSPGQIAEKADYLIDNPEMRENMGKKSRQFYQEKFTEDKMIENLSRVFNTVINK